MSLTSVRRPPVVLRLRRSRVVGIKLAGALTMGLLVPAIRAGRLRSLSARFQQAMAFAASDPVPPLVPRILLPTRHSRKKLPRICSDATQLDELTREALEAPESSLFMYATDKNTSSDAWVIADPTVQQFEYLIRGHAQTLPGTMWNRWVPGATESVDPNKTLKTMDSLIDRIWEEGRSYMLMRASRLEEVNDEVLLLAEVDDETHGELEAGAVTYHQDEDETDADLKNVLELSPELSEGDELAGAIDPALNSMHEDTDADVTNPQDEYFNDFALPGPTTHMYDTLLDAMACQASAEFVTPSAAHCMFNLAIARHELDGGDTSNTNPHTRPTAISFNAPIRVAASLPYDATSKRASNIRLRDEAIHLALQVFDAISQSTLERNSATYAYLIQVIAKYFPASCIKGNIAHGMFHHALTQGLLDQIVIEAYLAANAPSNGDSFDDWITANLKGKDLRELPLTWRGQGRVRRQHPREPTY